jgi:uncharacterized protein
LDIWMLLKSRETPGLLMRLRLALWPRRNFARSARYAGLRIARLQAAPHALALGVATGVFVATLPIPGIQLAMAALLAWGLGACIPAALLATFWANPLTLPILWLSGHWIGKMLLGGPPLASPDVMLALHRVLLMVAPSNGGLAATYAALLPLLKPLALGCVILGGACAAAFYAGTLLLLARRRPGRRAGRPSDMLVS